AFRKIDSQRSKQVMHSRNVRAANPPVLKLGDWQCLEYRISLPPVVMLGQVADDVERDEVHHDRRDDFVSAEPCLQDAWYSRPDSSEDHRTERRQENDDSNRPALEHQADPGCDKGPGDELSFSSYVQ